MFTATNEIKSSKLFAFTVQEGGSAVLTIDNNRIDLTAKEVIELRDYIVTETAEALPLSAEDQT